MSASSSNSLSIPPDRLLPLMGCPLCGDEIESNVARSGSQAGQRFYKCIRYDARQCRFFEFQRAYWRRMSPMQIAAAQQQAGMHPGGQVFGLQHANAAAQLVPAINPVRRRTAKAQPAFHNLLNLHKQSHNHKQLCNF
ncbi:uncharacterized protein LOC119349170 [Triticum dicoccoides]|uniref:uncharacterized protein LOC119349170 n=1 Tax=Triticum dicoccoides TaxID=85692 RepID=UPI000E7CD39F|nr:uncharacterized protein LOC119349170 [Triticum dicoccoides]